MKGIDAYELIGGLDDELLSEVETVLGTEAVTGMGKKQRTGKMMPGWAVAACVCVCALAVYIAVLSLGGGGFVKLFRHGEVTETVGETGTTPDGTTGEDETRQDTRLPMDESGLFPLHAEENKEEVRKLGAPYPLVIGKYRLEKGMTVNSEKEPVNWYNGQRINLETGIGSPICADPYCKHGENKFVGTDPEDACPFNSVGEFCFTYGDKLYYTRQYSVRVQDDKRGHYEYHDVFGSYDIYLGIWTPICDSVCPDSSGEYTCEGQRLGHFVSYGTYGYALQYVPKNGVSDSLDDYTRYLVRVDPAADQAEYLLDVTDLLDPQDRIVCIRNGTVILQSDTAIKTWNPASKFIRVLISFDEDTSCPSGLGDTWLYGDRLYLTIKTKEQNAYGKQISAVRFCCIDLVTGDMEPVYNGFVSRVLCDGTRALLMLSNNQPDVETLTLALPFFDSDDAILRDMRTVLAVDLASGTTQPLGQIQSFEITPLGLVQYMNWQVEDGQLVCDRYAFDMSTGITRDTVSGSVIFDPASVNGQSGEASE